MAERTAIREVVVTNAQGLHARPAHLFVTCANRFRSRIEVIKDAERVDGKSILSVLTLAAVKGTRLVLRAEGEDAEEAVEALAQLFAKEFHDAGNEELPQNQASGPPGHDGDRQSG